MDLLRFFVSNPVKVAVGVLLVALFGLVSLNRMPVQLTPEVQIPQLTVETRWPGAGPREVEWEIVRPQEERLRGVEGMVRLVSESMDSRGRITMEFAIGTRISEAVLRVNERLQQVRGYPEAAERPVIDTAGTADRPIAWFVLLPRPPDRPEIDAFLSRHPHLEEVLQPVVEAHRTELMTFRLDELAERHPELRELVPPRPELTQLRRFAEEAIEARFRRVQGVGGANVVGGKEEEMQVVVDPRLLAARQLTIEDLRRALRARVSDVAGGDFWEGKRRNVVRTIGQFRSADEVASTIVASRDGTPVRVGDVAEVRLGFKKPEGLARRFGTASVALNVSREAGANVFDVMDGLGAVVDDLNEGILKRRGLWLRQVYDETEYIDSAIQLVNQNIVLGGILTILTLLVFLRSHRPTIVIALAIPVSIVGTFLILHLLGRTFNVVSLAGLAFAVGMLVDNAVVVLESIFRRHQEGDPPMKAAVEGTREVWGAVLASTATTLAVFLPVLFVEEEAGQLFRDIALAVSAAVGLSLVVSVSVIPTAASRLLGASKPGGRPATTERPRPTRRGRLRALPAAALNALDASARGFTRGIVGLNARLQRSTPLRLGVATTLIGGSLLASRALMPSVEYLPEGNRNLVIGVFVPPPGYNIEHMLEIGRRIEDRLRPYWEAEPGSPEAAALEYPTLADFFYVARGRQIFMGLRADDPRRARELLPLVRALGEAIPGAFAVARQSSLFERGLSAGRTVDVEITGPDLVRLVDLGGEVLESVGRVLPGAQAIPRPSLDLSSPEVHVRPRWRQAVDMGVELPALGYAVDALVDGAYAGDYLLGDLRIDLTIMGRPEAVERMQDVEALPIATPGGDLVSLGSLARVELATGPEQINRVERQRAVTIQVTPPAHVALEEAMERIAKEIVAPMEAAGRLDGDYQVRLAGTADRLRSAWNAMRFNLLLAVLIAYLLMAGLFESWIHPLVIMVSVPVAAVGGFAGLWLVNLFTHQPLDVITMLGFVILVGTSVNNAILIVHRALRNMRESGLAAADAVVESVGTRIRPIFMTTTTTIFGLLPLVVMPGAGSELYRGLGGVVLGGLAVSALFTLVLVPTLFGLLVQAGARPRLEPLKPGQ